jgi:hypothetical protein
MMPPLTPTIIQRTKAARAIDADTGRVSLTISVTDLWAWHRVAQAGGLHVVTIWGRQPAGLGSSGTCGRRRCPGGTWRTARRGLVVAEGLAVALDDGGVQFLPQVRRAGSSGAAKKSRNVVMLMMSSITTTEMSLLRM